MNKVIADSEVIELLNQQFDYVVKIPDVNHSYVHEWLEDNHGPDALQPADRSTICRQWSFDSKARGASIMSK